MSSPTDRIASRQQASAEAVRRANQWAGLSRILAGVVAVFGMGVLGVFVYQAGVLAPAPPQEVKTAIAIENPNQITGKDSRISGVDRNQRPYRIEAKTGQQDTKINSLVHLQTVTGVFERPSGAQLDVTAANAQYDTKTKDLALEGDVVFGEGDRFKARMDKAKINMDDQSLQSAAPVKVDMQGTMIEADSLSVTDNGNRILFKGGVKARFVTKPTATGDGG